MTQKSWRKEITAKHPDAKFEVLLAADEVVAWSGGKEVGWYDLSKDVKTLSRPTKDEVKPVGRLTQSRPLSEQFSNVNKSGEGPRYSRTAVQKEINKDRRIGGKEAQAIHALLKGRTGDSDENPLKLATQSEADIATEYGDGTQFKKGDTVLHNHKKGTYRHANDVKPVPITGKGANVAPMAKLIPRSKRPKAEDANPFERDTDAGAERIVRREAKAGLSAERIAKKYGFSLSFVKEVLGDVKPVGDAFKTIPKGTKVTWHYRSAIGHGTVTGVHKMGTTAANTTYSVHEEDHHPGEPSTVYHSGAALTRA